MTIRVPQSRAAEATGSKFADGLPEEQVIGRTAGATRRVVNTEYR